MKRIDLIDRVSKSGVFITPVMKNMEWSRLAYRSIGMDDYGIFFKILYPIGNDQETIIDDLYPSIKNAMQMILKSDRCFSGYIRIKDGPHGTCWIHVGLW